MQQLALPIAAPLAQQPEPECIRQVVIDRERRLRFVLREAWGQGAPVLWCMLNPSWATDTSVDMTMLRVRHFTRAWGFKGWSIVNLYPWITSDPVECYRRMRQDEDASSIHAKNRDAIRSEVENAAMVVAAWGAGAREAHWTNHIADVLQSVEARNDFKPMRPLYCLGASKGGAPLHPMARGRARVPDDRKPMPWKRPEQEETY